MKALVADDSPISRRMLEAALTKEGFDVLPAVDGAEALRVLDQEDCPRLVILDWIMPQVDGLQVCRQIRQKPREPYIYLILVTAKGEQKEIIEGLESGADDYMTKPFDINELRARVRSGKRILELEEQLVSARELLRIQATHDSLTGLLNRGAVLVVLEREIARAARQGSPVAVISMDVDHFKQINDTYGHQTGDAVLKEVAQRMQVSLRAYDAIGRFGGEEFLVVLPGCDAAVATKVAERILHRVSAESVSSSSGPISVTISLGVASTAPEPMPSSQLLRAADEALYAAKRNGRNRVEVHSALATTEP